FLVDTSGLSRILDLEPQLLRSGVDAARLVRAEAGIRLRELNVHLDAHRLALSNMGGYDGQTVAGVISTSTHGSGITFGPLPEQIRCLDLVAGGGAVDRPERRGGPAPPGALARRRPGARCRTCEGTTGRPWPGSSPPPPTARGSPSVRCPSRSAASTSWRGAARCTASSAATARPTRRPSRSATPSAGWCRTTTGSA